MELKAIRLFVALADELHFGKAAIRAGVTQSVLSVQIKRLEDLLGAPLLFRTTREVALTDVGRAFRKEAEGILRRVDQAVHIAKSTARGRGRVLRIGITSAVEVSNLMGRVGSFRSEFPDAQVIVRELGTVDQEAALVSGDIDVGILHPPLDQTDLVTTHLGVDPFVAAYNPEFYALPSRMDWKMLFANPIIFYSRRRAPRLFDKLIALAQKKELNLDISAEAESFFAAVAMAQAGLGVAMLPKTMLGLNHKLTTKTLPKNSPFVLETACALHESKVRDELIRKLINHLQNQD